MDFVAIAASLSSLIAPVLRFLRGTGRPADEADPSESMGDAAWSALQALWERLWPRLKADPKARGSVDQAQARPEDEGALAQLAAEIRRVLDENPDLATSAREVVAEASTFRASGGGVAANEIEGPVVTGDENVVQTGKTNINIGTARDVTIGQDDD